MKLKSIIYISIILFIISGTSLLRSCSTASSQEREFLVQEILIKRNAEQHLLSESLKHSSDDECKRVYRAMLAYHYASNELFATLSDRGDQLLNDKPDVSAYTSDQESSVRLLELSAETLDLYSDAVEQNQSKDVCEVLLAVLPDLMNQNEDLLVVYDKFENVKGRSFSE